MITRKRVSVFVILFCCIISSGWAQEEPRFSHRGVKAALASGSFEMTGERNLREGDSGALSLGYGFTDRFSLWLTLTGSEHLTQGVEQTLSAKTEFGGLELNLQHKFQTEDRLQPYAKVGFGIYGLHRDDTNKTLTGAGINLAVGLDFFFSRHFGVGAEFMWKKLDYLQERTATAAGDLVRDLNPDLNGDTAGLMLTFTVQ